MSTNLHEEIAGLLTEKPQGERNMNDDIDLSHPDPAPTVEIVSKDELTRLRAELAQAKSDLARERERAEKAEAELSAYRNDGVTEEILRRQDGQIHVGNGCEIAVRGTTQQLTASEQARKLAVEALNRALKAVPNDHPATIFILNALAAQPKDEAPNPAQPHEPAA